MTVVLTNLETRAGHLAGTFGAAVRARRTASGMTQDQLALATGVGRRFVIDLEAGKPSCHLGRSLLVAETLGVRLADILTHIPPPGVPLDDLPPPSEEES